MKQSIRIFVGSIGFVCLFIYSISLSFTKGNSNLDASFTLCNNFEIDIVMKSNGYSKIAHNQFTDECGCHLKRFDA